MFGRVSRSCIRYAIVYGWETWVLRKEEEGVLQRTERAMVRRMCGVRLRDRKRSEVLMQMLELDVDVVTLVRRARLRWYGHVLRRDEESGIKRTLGFEVEGNRGRGRPRLSWREQVDKDRVTVGMDMEGQNIERNG